MRHWLIKSEGDCYSIDDLKRDGVTSWSGIRNFRARNFMRDDMQVGDLVLFYHSVTQPIGICGIAKVASKSHIDMTALDPKDEHFDPKAVKYEQEGKAPLWMCVDMKFVKKFKQSVTLDAIKNDSQLNQMLVAQRGQRLSIMPVEVAHFERVLQMGN